MFDLVRFTRDYLRCQKCPHHRRLAIQESFCDKWKGMCVSLIVWNACDGIKEKANGLQRQNKT